MVGLAYSSSGTVIEHGGIFAATYKIPKIGTAVNLRVLLPGDYEFTATAVVQWTREGREGDSDPGFGAPPARTPPPPRTARVGLRTGNSSRGSSGGI